ncbi:MAG: 4Fe-4S dicluster domain-containing protein [Acidobacteria bacterium]|nr:4Fe-4S dicluster domain-containing protein [Acidobacteriota bacterium]
MADETIYSRRGFFKTMGLSVSAAALASCKRIPVHQIIPFLVQPDDIRPGVAMWYASTCGACPAACGLLVKTRDGRPIKIEGNELHPVSKGGVCAIGQASVLTLYDAARSHEPLSKGSPVKWRDLDRTVRNGLRQLASTERAIRLVTPPYLGPTGEAAVAHFLAAYPTARRVSHDPLGSHAIARAHHATHGLAAIPAYNLKDARLIVSFASDFLGTWVQPVSFTKNYAAGRDPARGERMLRHFQLEPNLTLTGSNADVRTTLRPSDVTPALTQLAKRLGIDMPSPRPTSVPPEVLDRLARELQEARGASLVLCGSDDVTAQCLTNAINEALGNYGTTIGVASGVKLAESQSVDQFLNELRSSEVGAVIVVGTNPVYSHPNGAELGERLTKVELTVATADRPDETAGLLQHLAPDHNYLESWGDSEPARGVLGLFQPTVAPLYDTRSAFESLLAWSGQTRPYYEFLRNRWETEIFPRAIDALPTFEAFWERSVHDGVARYTPNPLEAVFQAESVSVLLEDFTSAKADEGFELVLHPSLALRDGSLGNNAWLQELPDPVTKVTWGNAASISPGATATLGLRDGDLVNVGIGDRIVKLPVVVQPGMHDRVVAVGLGHGRTHAGSVGDGIGENAFVLAKGSGRSSLWQTGAVVQPAVGAAVLARSQTHESMEGRELVREINLEELLRGENLEQFKEEAHPSRWPRAEHPEQRWAMAVDLSKCTGCSACVVACRAENNIAIVGPDEVQRKRDMDWMHIDRYYKNDGDDIRILRQPMLCQHCENAPCETVCPVLATVHSSDGLNQQVYNRCVGTRYCANNCPFKVRRFNWFDYPRDETERMVLNPDVVVRSRGVMEKCSFCVQRIREAKTKARIEGRTLRDGDVRTACEQSCPADAIVVGDLNDPKSRVSEWARSNRAYRLLTHLNIEPAVRYLARIRNSGRQA